jgi:hypothetical protein
MVIKIENKSIVLTPHNQLEAFQLGQFQKELEEANINHSYTYSHVVLEISLIDMAV